MAHVFQEIMSSALPTPFLPGLSLASTKKLTESGRARAAFDLSENGLHRLHSVGVCLAAFLRGEQQAHLVRNAQLIRITRRKYGSVLAPMLLSVGRDVRLAVRRCLGLDISRAEVPGIRRHLGWYGSRVFTHLLHERLQVGRIRCHVGQITGR